MLDKWMLDICYLCHALLFSEAPREEIAAGLRVVFEPVDFGAYATLEEFVSALRECPDVDQGCIVVAAYAYLFLETDRPREEIVQIFADALSAIEELPEWADVLAKLEGIPPPPSGYVVTQ